MGFLEFMLFALVALFILSCASAFLNWMATGTPPRVLAGVARRWDTFRSRFRTRPEPMPPVLLGLELRRLAAEVARVEGGDQPAKAARMAACQWAYDYVLIEYCQRVDIPVPRERAPLSSDQRIEAEAALICAGHEW